MTAALPHPTKKKSPAGAGLERELSYSVGDCCKRIVTQIEAERQVREMLTYIDPAVRDDWIKCGMALKDGWSDVGFEIWLEWSSRAHNFSAKALRDAWKSFRDTKETRVTMGTVVHLAKQGGYLAPKPKRDDSEPDWAAIKRAKAFESSYKDLLKAENSKYPHGAPAHVGLLAREQRLWDTSIEITDTDGAAYLAERGCAMPPVYGDLRFHPAVRHPVISGYAGPALLGLITHHITGEVMSLQTTWICADGTKPAELGMQARLNARGCQKQGGVIRLWPGDEITHVLGIAEGIETALSLAWQNVPTWSAIDAGNLGSLDVLPGIECLLIAADHDRAGVQGTRKLAEKWGGKAQIVANPLLNRDLNDAAPEFAPPQLHGKTDWIGVES